MRKKDLSSVIKPVIFPEENYLKWKSISRQHVLTRLFADFSFVVFPVLLNVLQVFRSQLIREWKGYQSVESDERRFSNNRQSLKLVQLKIIYIVINRFNFSKLIYPSLYSQRFKVSTRNFKINLQQQFYEIFLVTYRISVPSFYG